jgi:hypothetical protein
VPVLTIADAFTEELSRRGITRAEAARLLGVHPDRISRWAVRGDEPAPDTYEVLQRFFNTDRAGLALMLMATREAAWQRRQRPERDLPK